jgi:hypothetical protein
LSSVNKNHPNKDAYKYYLQCTRHLVGMPTLSEMGAFGTMMLVWQMCCVGKVFQLAAW